MWVETEDYLVLAFGAVDGAQDIVGAYYRGGDSVDGACPPWVVYLAEYDGSVVGVGGLVFELCGAVVGEAYLGGAVGGLWVELRVCGFGLIDGTVSEVYG